MNASPNRLRGIAACTILASVFSFMLGGCSSKTNTVPVVQAPPGAPTTNVPLRKVRSRLWHLRPA